MEELVSVVVPVHNGEQYLRENIECIVNQTYKSIEIIYVCDNCTDKTIDILEEYALSDHRLKICQSETKQGAAISRNMGMKMAAGEWILFLDSDDLFELSMIEKMIGMAEEQKADMCCCFWEEFDKEPVRNASVTNANLKLHCNSYPIIDVSMEEKHILQLVHDCPWQKLIHKSIYSKNNVFFQDIPNCNDAYFSFISAVEATRIVYVDEVLVHYRNSTGRNTLSEKRKYAKNYVWEAYDKLYRYIDARKDNLNLKISFYNRVCTGIFHLAGTALFKVLYDSLRNVYFQRWQMWDDNIQSNLSYFNQEIYKKICAGDLSMDKYLIEMQAKEKFVRDAAGKHSCSIWGCGNMGKKLLERLNHVNVEIQHIFDSDPNKWGTEINGKYVERFEGKCTDNIIITASLYYEEIKKQIGKNAGCIVNLEKEIFMY